MDSESSAVNISDVIAVIETDPVFGETMMGLNKSPTGPYIEIIEQPAPKALRFRYECEGRSAGSIPGVNSSPENKTFPTIQIVGYKGRAVVVVSCVTKDSPHRPHPHNLVGREGCRKGVCTLEVNSETMNLSFANLGIQCVKKKDIEDALRIREDIRVDPFKTGFQHKTQPGSIDLNAVRLCFQAFIEGSEPGKFTIPLYPVVSDTIYDKKAMSDLVICKLSDCSSSVVGGKEIILLCEKVAKEDISVRLFEKKNGEIVWEGYGDFTPTQVHKQVAIAFKTPRYKSIEVENAVQVFIQLKRPSDGAESDPLPFTLTSLESEPGYSKRKKKNTSGDFESLRHLPENNCLKVEDFSHGVTVKREPPETSSNLHSMFAFSPIQASRTPSPGEYSGYGHTYSPVGMYQQASINYSPRTPSYSPSPSVQQMQQNFSLPMNDQYIGNTHPDMYAQNVQGTFNVANIPNGSEIFLENMVMENGNVDGSQPMLDSKDLADLADTIDSLRVPENVCSSLVSLNENKTVNVRNENMTNSLKSLSISDIFMPDFGAGNGAM